MKKIASYRKYLWNCYCVMVCYGLVCSCFCISENNVTTKKRKKKTTYINDKVSENTNLVSFSYYVIKYRLQYFRFNAFGSCSLKQMGENKEIIR